MFVSIFLSGTANLGDNVSTLIRENTYHRRVGGTIRRNFTLQA